MFHSLCVVLLTIFIIFILILLKQETLPGILIGMLICGCMLFYVFLGMGTVSRTDTEILKDYTILSEIDSISYVLIKPYEKNLPIKNTFLVDRVQVQRKIEYDAYNQIINRYIKLTELQGE